MACDRPHILVAAGDRRERGRIAATIAEAGFSVTEAAAPGGALAALAAQNFAAIVWAPQNADGGQFLRQARRRRPGLSVVLVLAPAAMPPAEAGGAAIVERPLDPRRLLGLVFDMVLRDEGSGDARERRAAELGIAAAQLACLDHRRAAAERSGSGGLARDLARRIAEIQGASRA
jgi:DNA-binding NtrC family response regulator